MADDKLTLFCGYCNQPFPINRIFRHKLYCSDSCEYKAKGDAGKVVSKCVVCETEFEHYGTKIVCGEECNAKYLAEKSVGQVEEVKGYSFNLFKTPKIKLQIRERDNFTCCFCGEEHKKIPVHHIDYDKHNNDESNLICLCKRCLKLTKVNHGYWQVLFAGLISGSKVVKKGWGFEIHIVNNEKYCLKYLVFFKGKKFSHHYHLIKQECWHCIFGKLELFLEIGEDKTWMTLNPGSKIEIFPGQIHQLKALKNSMIVEVSSRDFPEDSIRLMKGD